MKRLKQMLALVAALCLITTGALAGTAELDAMLSPYLDVNQDVRLSMGYEVNTLLPFGEDMTDMINGVLKHITLNTSLEENSMRLELAVDGAALISFNETREGDRFTLTTSALPNYTLTGAGDGMTALLGDAEAGETPFDLRKAIQESEACYQALTDAIAPYAEEKKANYKIADVGHGKWVRLAKLTVEQSTEILPQMIALLGCGMDEAFKQELQSLTCKNGFTIALYKTAEDGADLAVYMKGNVSMGEDDSRTLSYQWAFSREDGSKDTYKLELQKNSSPVNRRMIQSSVFDKSSGSDINLSMSNSVTLRTRSDTATTTEKHRLKGKQSDSRTTLTGILSTVVKSTIDGETTTVTTELEPDLTLTSAEGSGVLSGSIGLVEKVGKKTSKDVTIRLGSDGAAEAFTSAAADGTLYAVNESEGVTITIDGSSLAQNMDEVEALADGSDTRDHLAGKPPVGMTAYTTPGSMQTVDLDTASPEEIVQLQGALAQNTAGLLLRALAALPEEDTRLLRDNMSDEAYAAFTNLLSGL